LSSSDDYESSFEPRRGKEENKDSGEGERNAMIENVKEYPSGLKIT